ncbi:transposase [Pseudomonas sp. R4-83]|uniref:transposase n=1 Tax=unclassified Pseudomonas TaxID=196821 RepID=UPI003DAA3D77
MRQRTSYSKPFKAQVVQECLQPGVSMASVALRHGINANLVRKWIPAYRDHQPPASRFRPDETRAQNSGRSANSCQDRCLSDSKNSP